MAKVSRHVNTAIQALSEFLEAPDLRSLPLSHIVPDPEQPRQEADDELADSIRAQGVIQPILVRPLLHPPDRYQLVAGERRWRGAQKAGLAHIPAIVRTLSDAQARILQLIENGDRKPLPPLMKPRRSPRRSALSDRRAVLGAAALGRPESRITASCRSPSSRRTTGREGHLDSGVLEWHWVWALPSSRRGA
jgi:ParB family chromosome partitioning protein